MADEKPTDEKKKDAPKREERTVSTTLEGPHGSYTVTASTLNLKDDKGEDRASVFSVAYVLDGVDDPAARPVTFCFNGGPGSSAVWLQFGAFGPKRVDIPDTLVARPAPNALVDNPHGLLDLTDLVFIDPVGTGFSRPAGENEGKAFQSVASDAESVGEFVWRWLSRHDRWQSPKFLAGESYGTTRAGALAGYLQENGVALNGLVLLSLAMNFQTFIEEAGNDLPHVLYLPSFTATAWYHGRLPNPPEALEPLLEEVRAFAIEELAPALHLGARLPERRRRALARKMARYTGLPAAEIERRNLRVEYLYFARTLLGAGPNTVGRLDSRYVGPDLDPYGQRQTRDPGYDAALPAYTAAANDFLRRTVGWDSTDPYRVLSMEVNEGWSWQHGKRLGYVNTTEELRQALFANPHLKVLFANGLFDLATPFFAAEYTADHLGVPEEIRQNVSLTYYEAGHMMYFHPPSLAKLKADVAAFYEDALGG